MDYVQDRIETANMSLEQAREYAKKLTEKLHIHFFVCQVPNGDKHWVTKYYNDCVVESKYIVKNVSHDYYLKDTSGNHTKDENEAHVFTNVNDALNHRYSPSYAVLDTLDPDYNF